MPARRPTLYLPVGLPGVGKTTAARQVEVEQGALRLTKDEWVKALHGPLDPQRVSDVVEGRLVEVALRCLEISVDVVLDFGLWGRDERTALRHAAAERGAAVAMRLLEVDADEQRRRLDARWSEDPATTWEMSDADLAGWAAAFQIPTSGELDGSEPLDDPPDGLASWDAWRARRWPPSL